MKKMNKLAYMKSYLSKSFLIPFLLIFFLNVSAFSQLIWTAQNSLFATLAIKDSYFFDTQTGFIVGETGKIAKTEDGGLNWTLITSPVTLNLHGISFSSNTTGWIVGDNETLLKTTDGGNSWAVAAPPSGTSSHLYEIQFVDSNHGWILGYLDNFYTTDGGNTWIDFDPTGIGITVFDLDFINADEGYISGQAGALYHTTDGGQTWDVVPVLLGSDIYCVDAIDANNLFIGGSGGFLHHSEDGGDSWTVAVSSVGYAILDIDFQDENVGVAVGNGSTTLVTADGGITWSQPVVTSCDLTCVDMISDGIGWIGGYCGVLSKSSYDENDATVVAYVGTDTVCKNIPFEVFVEIYNEGPAPIDSLYFVVSDGLDILFVTQWDGYLSAGASDVWNLGSVMTETSGTFYCMISGDTVDSNNMYTKIITVIDPPGEVSGPHSICAGDSVAISAQGADSYIWMMDVVDSTAAEQVVYPTETQNYYVGIKSNYCNYIDTVIVNVNDCSELVTAISPNGDGINDYLELGDIPAMENEVKIFNRWGDLVNSFTNYDNVNVRWEGTRSDGENLTEGTYYYIFQTTDLSVSYSSWVQIVR